MSNTQTAATTAMSGTPIWIPILALVVSVAALLYSIFGPSARYAVAQKRILDEKDAIDKKLITVSVVRVNPSNSDIKELYFYNMNSVNIFIYGIIMNHSESLNIDFTTDRKGTYSVKPAEGTMLMRFMDPLKAQAGSGTIFNDNWAGIIEVYVFLSSDPNFVHIEELTIRDALVRSTSSRRITEEQYENLTDQFLANI